MGRLWLILATLTLARATMGFQFQSPAALGPVLTASGGLTHAELGALIGIYLLPGALFAIPGGWLGHRFGDKRVVLAGLGMMCVGGALLVPVDGYAIMFAGRLIAGVGAVLLNVLVSKMVTDWFAEHRLPTAMGVLISSWPLGIALALVVLGPLESRLGLHWAFATPVLICALAVVAMAAIYRAPPARDDSAGAVVGAGLSSRELSGVLLAGAVWCLYNVAFILPLSFGPELLVSRGMDLIEAGATVSLASWLIIPALPLGALVAERIGRPLATMAGSFVAIALLALYLPGSDYPVVCFALLGLLFGPAGGLIMALPSRVLRAENRAIGMGIFFTVYYVGMGVFPALAGYARDRSGDPAAPLLLAAAAIGLALLALGAFTRLARRAADRSA